MMHFENTQDFRHPTVQHYPKKRQSAGVRDPQENHLLHQGGYLSLVAVGF